MIDPQLDTRVINLPAMGWMHKSLNLAIYCFNTNKSTFYTVWTMQVVWMYCGGQVINGVEIESIWDGAEMEK